MFIALIICFITSLLPCYASWHRLKAEYKESTLFLFMGAIFYSLLFLYGITARLCLGNAKDAATIQQMYSLAGQTGFGLQQLQTLLVLSTYALSGINLILAYIVAKAKHPITYSLSFVIALIGILSITAPLYTGMSPFANFFVACCGIMAYFAYVLELTYKEFCVLGNIYLQAAICLIAAIAPVMVCLRKKSDTSSFLKLSVSLTNLIVHGVLFLIICKHYWMPLDPAFDLCYRELVHLASITGSTYIIVNLVIFVMLFVGDLILNSVLYKLVK